jgi:hypothetical protein
MLRSDYIAGDQSAEWVDEYSDQSVENKIAKIRLER